MFTCYVFLVVLLSISTNADLTIKLPNGKPAIEILYNANGIKVYDNTGSTASPMSIWRPADKDEFMILGMLIQPNHGQLTSAILMGRDLLDQSNSSQRAFAPPENFTQIWTDEGDSADNDIGVWRPTCPQGFVALGDIAQGCYQCGWPEPKWMIEFFRCVLQDFVEECGMESTPIWTDSGSLAYSDSSFWKVKPVNGSSTFFMGNTDHTTPPNDGKAWCLIKPQ